MKPWHGWALAIALAAPAPLGPAPPAAAADAPTRAIEGTWRVVIDQSRGRCGWRGTISLTRTGRRIAGEGQASPSKRQRRCPTLKGAVEGRIEGRQVRFGFATGRLGTAEFEGTLGDKPGIMSGRWSARRASGRWQATRVE